MFATAFCTPLPRYRFLSPSRSSIASFSPVEAPLGTAALPRAPDSNSISASTVGLPRESRISRACTLSILLITFYSSPANNRKRAILCHTGLIGNLETRDQGSGIRDQGRKLI